MTITKSEMKGEVVTVKIKESRKLKITMTVTDQEAASIWRWLGSHTTQPDATYALFEALNERFYGKVLP